MKKLFSVLLLTVIGLFAFSSCELDDNSPNFHFELLPVDSVSVPESFVMGKTYKIKAYYKRPSECYLSDGFYYEKDLNTRIFALQSKVLEQNNCAPIIDETLEESSFNFLVKSNGSYIFKFFNGEDAAGNRTYLEYEIPVVTEFVTESE